MCYQIKTVPCTSPVDMDLIQKINMPFSVELLLKHLCETAVLQFNFGYIVYSSFMKNKLFQMMELFWSTLVQRKSFQLTLF